jgi:small subunit ribosomal protein S18
MAYDKRSSSNRPRLARRRFHRKKVCRFCNNSDITIDYKRPDTMKIFLTERGKIMPRRVSGNCAKHQRELTSAIKRSRALSLLPFIITED